MKGARTGTSCPLKLSENSSKHIKERWNEQLNPQDKDKAEKPAEEQLIAVNLHGRRTLYTSYGVGSFHAFQI
jgi:hypothetical protein